MKMKTHVDRALQQHRVATNEAHLPRWRLCDTCTIEILFMTTTLMVMIIMPLLHNYYYYYYYY